MELMVGTQVMSLGNAYQVSGLSQASSSEHHWSIGTGKWPTELVVAVLSPSPLILAQL